MPAKIGNHQPLGHELMRAASIKMRRQRADKNRASSRDRGYTSKWDEASAAFRIKNPLCAYSALLGEVVATECVDHLYPHGGDRRLFWLAEFWIPSSNEMHNHFKSNIEREGLEAIDDLADRLCKRRLSEAYPDLAENLAARLGKTRRPGGMLKVF